MYSLKMNQYSDLLLEEVDAMSKGLKMPEAIDRSRGSKFMVPDHINLQLIQQEILQGPLANHTDFYYIEDGIYWNSECGTTIDDVDHAVLVVGYGTDPWSNQDYWIVKNSWVSTIYIFIVHTYDVWKGTSWGDDGYFKMARNAGNMCAIASFVSFPLVYDGIQTAK